MGRVVPGYKFKLGANGAVQRVFGKLAKTNLGSGEVHQNADGAVLLMRHRVNVLEGGAVLFQVSMSHVETKHIDAGGDQLADLLASGTSGADRRHDLGASPLLYRLAKRSHDAERIICQ